LQDFDSGEWLILFQWVDEPLTDLPQKNVPLIYQFARNEEERSYSRSADQTQQLRPAFRIATVSAAGSCEGHEGGVSENFARSGPDR
jgi:hypothetical protein